MTHWTADAECTREDPELFFPIGNTGPALLQIEKAREVCQRCGVSKECLRYATDTNSEFGVWGALTEGERLSMKRRRYRAPRKFVDPEPTIQRIRQAVDDGWSRNALRDATGVGADQLKAITDGTVKRIHQTTAQKIGQADLSRAARLAGADPLGTATVSVGAFL